MYSTTTLIISLVLLSLSSFNAWSSSNLTFDGKEEKIALSAYIDVLEDTKKTYTINDVIGDLSTNFKENTKHTINQNFSDSAFWLRFSLVNSTHIKQILYIENKISWVDSIKLYIVGNNGKYTYTESGSDIALGNRKIKHRNPLFSIELEAYESATYYIRVESKDALLLPLFLMTEKEFLHEDKFTSYFIGFILGIFVVMTIFNAFIHKAIKDKVYLWYTLYVFFYGINFLVLNNLFFPSSDTSKSYWNEFFHVGPLMLYFLFIIIFTINFLNINKHFPKLNVALKALILLILLSIISYFIVSYTFAVMLSTYIATFIPFILIGIGIYSALKKIPLAKFYIIAWFPNCCLFLVFAATFHGALEYNNFTGFANDIGMMLEVVLLALALAYRVRIFQQQTYDAQELLLQEQTQHTHKLNQMVLDRTKELESKNQELENLSKTDPLTGLYNRRKLDSTVLTNIKFSERYNNSFGLILLDLDDFKRINDKFGHYIGDEVLKKTAKILTKYTRSTDIVGRWGGEEFLIICPNTDEKSVCLITEKLCSAIYSESASDLAPFTASFGVAVYKQNETTEQLVTRTDKALYMSKDKGKNQFSIAV